MDWNLLDSQFWTLSVLGPYWDVARKVWNGGEWDSWADEFRSYCYHSNINHIYTAVDSPSSNGLNERLNQTLVNKIRCTKNDPSLPSRARWATLTKRAVDQYNSTPHSVTSFPPSYLLTGVPSSVLPPELVNPSDYEKDRLTALENTIHSHNYNKIVYDKNKLNVNFKIGDPVYISNGSKLNRNKLDVLRIGPYPISKQISNNVFEIYVGHGPFPHRLYHTSKIIPVCK